MICYFGYGSNMDKQALQLKGVCPLASERAKLFGWKLMFNLKTFFRHEGGMGNIQPSKALSDVVHGVLHSFEDEAIPMLDQMEGGGYAYKRIEVEVQTYDGQPKTAHVYVARPERILQQGLPSQRYLNILIRGATQIGLDATYIEMLRQTPTHPWPAFPPFQFPPTPTTCFNAESLKAFPQYTALAGAVFDITEASKEHPFLNFLFGGKDVTLFFLRRMDSSDGKESLEAIVQNCLTPLQHQMLNTYLHEFNTTFQYMGRFEY